MKIMNQITVDRPVDYVVLGVKAWQVIVAICYPFSQFCEINISPLSLQQQPKTAPYLFQRGVEYGKYAIINTIIIIIIIIIMCIIITTIIITIIITISRSRRPRPRRHRSDIYIYIDIIYI